MGLHCVLAGSQESLDPQVLLDPFEKQFNFHNAFLARPLLTPPNEAPSLLNGLPRQLGRTREGIRAGAVRVAGGRVGEKRIAGIRSDILFPAHRLTIAGPPG